MAPLTIDSFFKPTGDASTIPSKKRGRDTATSSTASLPETKKAKVAPKSSSPKLKKSTKPSWELPHFSTIAPTTPNAKKCVEKWNLHAPYDTRITEEQWAEYYEERSALEIMNTTGNEKWKKLESEELMQKTDKLLKEAGERLADAMMASVGLEDEVKTVIAETLRASVYYLDIWGCEEDGMDDSPDRTSFSPRDVQCKTRLYSPFGIGTSIDFVYTYYYRMFRSFAEAKWAVSAASGRDISDCNGKYPTSCAALLKQNATKPAEAGTKLFNWGGKSVSGIAATNLVSFEETLFSCCGWLSPNLMYQILCAGSTATIYQEPKVALLNSVAKKFKKFAGET